MTLTLLFVLIGIGVTIVFDIFLAYEKGAQATISALAYRSCQKYPIIAAALGALLYHLVSGNC